MESEWAGKCQQMTFQIICEMIRVNNLKLGKFTKIKNFNKKLKNENKLFINFEIENFCAKTIS